ncbi:MAG: ABC transporter ATP-binding protein [Deltaproteobacteria bacterium]|jgi:ABC-2 type transport system ATP-binding protein|nr:ABC transporter ATP-binding protein [Deltaproteobacteria bacterium]
MIKINNLDFSYKNTSLFHDLDMNLDQGNIYGLLGRNGAGKTTLLKLMTGLRFPDSGKIITGGFTASSRPKEMLEKICFIPEEIWVPPLTAKKYVQRYSRCYPSFSHELLKTHIEEFEVPYQRNLNKLSLGQKKKFLLAFGFASQCELLILDEPTNGLDIPSKSIFRRLVAEYIKDEQTVIISTHQVRDVENLIDPIIILDEGKVIFQQYVNALQDKFRIVNMKEISDTEKILYSEKTLGGYSVVMEADTETEAEQLDIETIFNIAVNNPDKLNKIMKGEDNE